MSDFESANWASAKVDSHLFPKDDGKAGAAISAALAGKPNP